MPPGPKRWKWSSERRSVIEERARLGVLSAWDDSLAAVNLLPGPKIASTEALIHFAVNRKKARTDEWSVDQVNLLVTLRRDGAEWDEIKAAINLMPGKGIYRHDEVAEKYHEVTGDEFDRVCGNIDAIKAARQSDAGVPVEAIFFKNGRLEVPYQTARQWAVKNGFCNRYTGLNLVEVNKARVAAGQYPFAIRGAL